MSQRVDQYKRVYFTQKQFVFVKHNNYAPCSNQSSSLGFPIVCIWFVAVTIWSGEVFQKKTFRG